MSRKVCDYLPLNNIPSPDQHGLLNKRSTCTNLLKCYNDWSLSIQSREQTRPTVIYVDFLKAFDNVLHARLFYRLHSYGIRDNVLLWLKGFSVIAKCVLRSVHSCLMWLNLLVVLSKVVF